MECLPIAELKPELPNLPTKQFKAIITLLWPYSSSTRQCALLLAEPDFRLRRKKGQVRVRFTGASAKAIAESGAGIGDEMIIGLGAVQFVPQETGISTPGKSIDWELSYSHTLDARISRNGEQIARIELDHAPPTSTPASPTRRQPVATPVQRTSLVPESDQLWSSPAFLKRSRLSGPPFFDLDSRGDNEDGPAKKRRRKSYKDWTVWKYAPRTPSPEKEESDAEYYAEVTATPIRRIQSPITPTTPSGPVPYTVAALPTLNGKEAIAEAQQDKAPSVRGGPTDATSENPPDSVTRERLAPVVRDADYYDLYAGPDEFPPSDMQFAYGGDTEPNTEEESVQSASEKGTAMIANVQQVASTEKSGHLSGDSTRYPEQGSPSHSRVQEGHTTPTEPPVIVMPPPHLPSLLTSFQAPATPELLTPIGQQPRSPVILPLDSSTLPMPSPFPGEREGGSNISYFEQTLEHPAQSDTLPEVDAEKEPSKETSSIVESSFYSSLGPAYTSFHTTHESAFTDVRFTFGMDGSALSHPKDPTELPARLGGVKEPSPAERAHHIDAQEERVEAQEEPGGPEEERVDTQGDHGGTEEEHVDTLGEKDNIQEGRVDTHEDLMGTLEGRREDLAEGLAEEAAEEVAQHVDTPGEVDNTQGEHMDTIEERREELAEELTEEIAEEVAEELQADVLGELPRGFREELREEFREEFAEDLAEQEVQEEADLSNRVHELHPSNIFQEFTNENAHSDIAGLIPMDTELEQLVGTDEQSPKPPQSLPKVSVLHSRSERDTVGDQSRRVQSIVEIIDLGSPSGSEIAEDEILDDHNDMITHSSESVVREASRIERSTPPSQGPLTTFAHTEPKQESDTKTATDDTRMESTYARARSRTGEVDITMVNISTGGQKGEVERDREPHPDVTFESIEDDVIFQINDHAVQDDASKSPASESAEVLIAVPEGHKMGELKYKSVAGTAPARNTRSKTKSTVSPMKDVSASPEPRAQTRRSKTTLASTRQMPTGPNTPMKLRSGSTVSPSQRVVVSPRSPSKKSSPYRTRSQAQMSSTEKSFSPSRQYHTPRKRPDRRASIQPASEIHDFLRPMDSFPGTSMEFPDSVFEPSQELDSYSGKFKNVPYVKDSEEGSLHSEHSLSTVPFSDDYDGYRAVGFSDTIDPVYATEGPSHCEATSSHDGRRKTSPRRRVTPSHKTPEQPVFSPPARKLDYTSGHPVVHHDTLDEDDHDMTPKAVAPIDEASYRQPSPQPGEGELVQIPSSPPRIPELLEPATRSPSPAHLEKPLTFASINQYSLMNGNMPITPDATQQTFTQSQPSFGKLEPSLPMTPQLTQATSAGLDVGSFSTKIDVANDKVSRKPSALSFQAHESPQHVTRSKIHSSKPLPRHSEDLSDSDSETETQLATTLSPPSIGLSTPTSYYTPLKDLTYFLGRSSQFHTSSCPDVLALVVSDTTPPKRASQGPKHYTTALSVSDISTFPETTSVQVFRAFSSALPIAEAGDVILLRAFQVKSLNRKCVLVSGDESAWCVWRWGKPVWGVKKQTCAEVRAREEIRGPVVEMGEGEWREVERLRALWVRSVRRALQQNDVEGGHEERESTSKAQNGDVKSAGKIGHPNGKA